MDLQTIRQTIDRIDTSLLRLLKKRMENARLSKQFKKAVKDENREKEIYAKLEQHSGALLSKEFLYDLYTLILKESKRIQEND